MAIVPKPLVKRVDFFASRLAAFAEHAQAIGTDPETVAMLHAQVEAARAAHRTQLEAQAAARTATAVFNRVVKAVNHTGASIVLQVRSKAQSTGDRGIYSLARIPPVADKSPLGPPGTPTNFSTDLDRIGQLTLRWTCKNPRGSRQTLYRVFRRVGVTGEQVFLGATGKKQFTDTTIPAGTTSLLYEVQAVRSTLAGQIANFTVSFGSNVRGATNAVPTLQVA